VLLARQLYFEAVKVGDELPPLVKPPVDRSQVARFCGAAGDFGPHHGTLNRFRLDEVGPGHAVELGAVLLHQLGRVMARD
jgi:hypothetical protein